MQRDNVGSCNFFLCFSYLDILRSLYLWRPQSEHWKEFDRKIFFILIEKDHTNHTDFSFFQVKDIHFTSISVQIFLQENSYLILPYLSIRVIFCVGVGACFVLFPILCLAYSVLYGVFPDGFQFISMDFSDVSMHLFWAFVIFCGVGIVIGKYEFEL